MNRIIFHIDVNSAYLSWTSAENLRTGAGPDLRNIPAIIGGDQSLRRGVVLAKSIPAKAFGIRTGEPVMSARKKCPELTIASPNHELYSEYSHRLMDFLSSLTPDIEQVSIDECYLDFTEIAHRYLSPAAAAGEFKDEIYQRFGFTVNIGISSNKLLAKMASDFEKPNKVHTLFPEEIPKKMWPLPVDELFMAGRSSVDTLHKLGIRTIGELAAADVLLLESHLKSHGRTLWEYANGFDETPVNPLPAEAKGIGNSTTLPQDAVTAAEAYAVLLELSETVSSRLRKARQLAGNICVEIKYSTFQRVSHQMPADSPINTCEGIYRISRRLFDTLWDGTPVRLLGIRTAKLVSDDAPIQLSLFDFENPKTEKEKRLDAALDSIRQKFGKDAVMRGSSLKPPRT
ncbi:DNA polymerase IV [Lachnospiraceae bacterium 46-15]